MSEAVAPAAPVAAPVEAAKPVPSTPPPEPKAKAPEPEPSDDYEIDGKTVRLTRTQARTAIQKAAAADKRLQEAAEEKKRVAAEREEFEADPEEYYRKRGKDPDAILAKHIEKKAKLALMTPEQIAADKKDRELEALRTKDAAAEKAKTEAAQKAADLKNAEVVEQGLIAAADKYNLDADPDVLDGLAAIGGEYLDHGIVLSFDQIAQEYQRREQEHIAKRDAKRLAKLDGKKLLAYLGEANLAKVKAALAEADAESLKAIPAPKAKVQVKAHTREVKGHIRESDFDRKFGL